jgi:hypothetical protein
LICTVGTAVAPKSCLEEANVDMLVALVWGKLFLPLNADDATQAAGSACFLIRDSYESCLRFKEAIGAELRNVQEAAMAWVRINAVKEDASALSSSW